MRSLCKVAPWVVGFLNASFLRPQASDPRKSLETLAFWPILGHLLGSVFHTSRKALRKEAELKSSTLGVSVGRLFELFLELHVLSFVV